MKRTIVNVATGEITEAQLPDPPQDYDGDNYVFDGEATYTPRDPEEVKTIKNARVLAQIAAKERNELLPRSVREFLLEQPGAQGKGWYAKVKGLDDEIVALKATLRT